MPRKKTVSEYLPDFSREERQIRQRLKDDFPHYASRCLKIRPKTGRIRNFQLNKVQERIHEIAEEQIKRIGRVRLLVLKARQPGVSTYVEGRFYWKTTHSRGARAFILTHIDDATDNLFEMAKRFHANCPPVVKPQTAASNAKELKFGMLDSSYRVGTAKAEGVGRSDTIQFFMARKLRIGPTLKNMPQVCYKPCPMLMGRRFGLKVRRTGHQAYSTICA